MESAPRRLSILSQHLSASSSSSSSCLSPHAVAGKLCNSLYASDLDGVAATLHPNGCLQITLNRPSKLNALTLPMLKRVQILVARAEFDPEVSFVLITAAGKAFCAGGDIMTLVEAWQEKKAAGNAGLSTALPQSYDCGLTAMQFARVFFATEYNLDRLLGEYVKPIVALCQGVWMGGGVGLGKNATFQVCNETTLFAMPESGIGLFPDVSASYFLPRLQGQLGLYLGLCSVRLKGAEVKTHGIASHYVPSDKFAALQKELTQCVIAPQSTDAQARDTVRSVLDRFAQSPPQKDLDSFDALFKNVNRLFVGPTIHHVLDNLKIEGSPWAKECLTTIHSKCPTSQCLFWETYHRGKQLDLASCMTMEYRGAIRMVEREDFVEGTLVALKKKQGEPVYDPPRIDRVEPSSIRAILSPMPDEELEFYQIRPRA
jgi:enoyl-CoA hydratase/carnithine racemase